MVVVVVMRWGLNSSLSISFLKQLSEKKKEEKGKNALA